VHPNAVQRFRRRTTQGPCWRQLLIDGLSNFCTLVNVVTEKIIESRSTKAELNYTSLMQHNTTQTSNI
jgi:hypothetical protein